MNFILSKNGQALKKTKSEYTQALKLIKKNRTYILFLDSDLSGNDFSNYYFVFSLVKFILFSPVFLIIYIIQTIEITRYFFFFFISFTQLYTRFHECEIKL